eukprot:CAMPEP_0113470958 /NCGR_PEP_ID=MMETSP0014_2-20120614/16725_1 /TAXON_ID=2857 /ORGANISM="Nitzschia sp." /LENGTH=344 /DNA_ID=CAMNT_0000363567 /DNA_START=85 /DNA_END=1119 /DNA_ORIENTATION=- /assembly_acc=CAM_ASM_000159
MTTSLTLTVVLLLLAVGVDISMSRSKSSLFTAVDAFSVVVVQDPATPASRRRRCLASTSTSTSALSLRHSSSPSSSLLSSSSSNGNEDTTIPSTSTDDAAVLPSLESLKKDPFMKQVQHGSILTEELKALRLSAAAAAAAKTTYLRQALNVQLSHSDGVRGFMVSYLTYEDDEDEDDDDNSSKEKSSASTRSSFIVPEELLQSVIIDRLQDNDDDDDDLVSLMCMNVVMPTAMVTMHTDRELSNSSARTSQRGMGLLRTVLEQERNDDSADGWGVETNLRGIIQAATSSIENDEEETKNLQPPHEEVDERLVNYWNKFFDNYGYQKEQRDGIADAANKILTMNS